MIQTKQQQRASFALEKIESLSNNGKINSDLATFIVGMPNMILSNGLGQTLAFLLSKGNTKGEKGAKQMKIFLALKEWLEKSFEADFPKSDNMAFLKQLNVISQQKYLNAQNECLRLVEWLKRYARAFEDQQEAD